MLYATRGGTQYLDYNERALFNHILSTQHPEHGGLVYFTSMRPGHFRMYSQPEHAMWCCVGSGIENHSKYGEVIYNHRGDRSEERRVGKERTAAGTGGRYETDAGV